MVFHSPHAPHRPDHWGVALPHSAHRKTGFVLVMFGTIRSRYDTPGHKALRGDHEGRDPDRGHTDEQRVDREGERSRLEVVLAHHVLTLGLERRLESVLR